MSDERGIVLQETGGMRYTEGCLRLLIEMTDNAALERAAAVAMRVA